MNVYSALTNQSLFHFCDGSRNNHLCISNATDRTSDDENHISPNKILAVENNKVFYGVLLPSFIYVCICLFVGFMGNILVIYVYSRGSRKSTPRTFIISLAIIDLFACLLNMTTELALLKNFMQFDYPVLCKLSRFTTSFCTNTTSVVLVAMAIDRYVRICKPLSINFDIRAAKITLIAAVLFGIATSWPFAILYGTQTFRPFKTNDTNIVGKTCLIEDRMLGTKYPLILGLFILCAHGVCDSILILLYTLIGLSVAKQLKMRRTLSEQRFEITTVVNLTNCNEMDDNVFPVNETTISMKKHTKKGFMKQHSKTEKRTPANSNSGSRPSLKFRRQTSRLQSSNSLTAGENFAGKTTIMIFLVTLVFVISFLPVGILLVLRTLKKGYLSSLSDVQLAFFNLFLRSYFLNSVLNPIVYSFLSQHFRKKVTKMLNSCFRPKVGSSQFYI